MSADGSPRRRLPWPALLGYSGLALPLAALNLPLYVYLPTFYSSELHLDLAAIGTTLLVARLLDVLTDPIVGELSDRMRGRLAQRRAWLLLAAPLLMIATWRLFVPPPDATITYLLAWSIIAYVSWTVMLIAYYALGAELSGHYDERTRITSAREGCIIVGILVAAGLPSLLGVKPESTEALRVVALLMVVGVPVTLTALVFLVGEGERRERGAALPILRGLRIVVGNRPFRRLIVAYLLNGMANGFAATVFILFAQNVIGTGADTGNFLLLYFGSGMLAIPLWLALSYRIGKHRAWSVSMLWACIAFVWVPLLGHGDTVPYAVACVLSGISIGADLALPSSMQADVVDLDQVESGRQRTGFYMALWSMASKMSLALAVGIAFPILDLVGFTAGQPNSETALFTLAALYALVPVAIKLVTTTLVWRFDLDAGRQAELRHEIETGSSDVERVS